MLHPPPLTAHPLSPSLPPSRARPASPALTPLAAPAESSSAGYFASRGPATAAQTPRRASHGGRGLEADLNGTVKGRSAAWKAYLDLRRDELAVLDDALGLEAASDAELDAYLCRVRDDSYSATDYAGTAQARRRSLHDDIDEQRTPQAPRTRLAKSPGAGDSAVPAAPGNASQGVPNPEPLFPPSPPPEASPGVPQHPLRVLARAVRELGEAIVRLEEENVRLTRRKRRSVDQLSIHNDLTEALSTSLTSPDGLHVPRPASPTPTATSLSLSLPVSRPKSPSSSAYFLPFPASPDPKATVRDRRGSGAHTRDRASSRGSASLRDVGATEDKEQDRARAGSAWGFWWKRPPRKASAGASVRSTPSRVDEDDGDDDDDEHAWRRGDGGSAPSFRAIYYATRIITPDPASILVSTTLPSSTIAKLAHGLVSAARDAGIVARDPAELRRERSRSRAASLSASSVRREDAAAGAAAPRPKVEAARGTAPAWAGAAGDTVAATVSMGRSLLSSVSTATMRGRPLAPPPAAHADDARPSLLSRSSSTRHFQSGRPVDDSDDEADAVPVPSVEMASILPDAERPPTVLLNRRNLGSFFQSDRAKIATATRFNSSEPPLTDRYGFIYDIQHAAMLKDANAAGAPAPASLSGQAPEPEGWIERRRRSLGAERGSADSGAAGDAEDRPTDAASIKSGRSGRSAKSGDAPGTSTVPSPRGPASPLADAHDDAGRSRVDVEQTGARERDTARPRKRTSTLLTLNPSPARPTAAKDAVTISARGASSLQPGIAAPAPATATPSTAAAALAHPGLAAAPPTPAPGASSRLTVSSLLDRLTDMHDRQQAARTAEWDAFLRRRPARAYASGLGLGEFAQLAQAGNGNGGSAGGSSADDHRAFLRLVRRGVPIKYRPDVWAECSGAKDARVPGEYDEILAVHKDDACAVARDIEKDVGRTFPGNVFFGGDGPGVAKLRRVLTAYAWYNPAVGYCQGMNMLAATLLLTHEDEEQAFYVLACVIDRLLPADFFAPSLLGSRAAQAVLAELAAEHVPKVSRHLARLGVDLASVTFGWFLSLFTDCLPVETLFRVWDVFFVEGADTLYRVALAVLKMHEAELGAAESVGDLFALTGRMTARLWAADRLIAMQHGLRTAVKHADIEARFRRQLALLSNEA